MDKQIRGMNRVSIAIDGYSGCGKSTLAKELATELGFKMIDSGALYRAIAYQAIKHGCSSEDISEQWLKQQIQTLDFSSNNGHILLNGLDIEHEIRTNRQVVDRVSEVAALPQVRSFLLLVQNQMIQEGNVVMEGRDIGTVVMPEAELKLFITARPEVRATRRQKQLKEAGKSLTLEELLVDLDQRDKADANRAVAPLALAKDAVVIDNSDLSREEQLKMALALCQAKLNPALLPHIKK